MSVYKTILFAGMTYVIPQAISLYRNIRRGSVQNAAVGTQIPPSLRPSGDKKAALSARWSMNVLFVSALLFFTLTLSMPPNIFIQTDSSLKTPTGVLFNKLKKIRPLTEEEERLKVAFTSSWFARIVYAFYGLDTTIGCTICGSEEDGSQYAGQGPFNPFFVYYIPQLLAPHLAHLLLLGLATSSTVGGLTGVSWRGFAVSCGLLLACAELFVVANLAPARLDGSRWKPGGRVALADPVFVFWSFRLARYAGFALFDAALAWFMKVWSEGRWPGQQPDPVLQLLEARALLDHSVGLVAGLLGADGERVAPAVVTTAADSVGVEREEGDGLRDPAVSGASGVSVSAAAASEGGSAAASAGMRERVVRGRAV